MLSSFGSRIVDSLLVVPCNVSFVLRVETFSVRLDVGCVFVLILWNLSSAFIYLACPLLAFPLPFVIAPTSMGSPSADTSHPPFALTNDLIASMIFGYV